MIGQVMQWPPPRPRPSSPALMVMVGTPVAARWMGLDNPRSAMVFGGLTGDRDKIGQVLTNLLSNAAKYSLHHQDIRLDCRKEAAKAQIKVTDRGMGIRETDLPYLFARFQRFESAETKNISGFGIGLYLCAEIVKSHNGRIWAESEFGAGTTMIFELPL